MIRDKIKEICENLDKFKLKPSIPTRIIYDNIEIINGRSLSIQGTEIDLFKEEEKFLKNFAEKRWRELLKKEREKQQKIEEDLLNSITFKQDDKK
jgi:hypothetical protein